VPLVLNLLVLFISSSSALNQLFIRSQKSLSPPLATPEGVWHSQALPFSGNRPKLVGTEDSTLYLIFSSRDQVQIAQGVPHSDRSAWKWSLLKLPDPHPCFGDPLVDINRWNSEEILSIYSQHPPAKLIRTNQSAALDGLPSPLHVADYRLNASHSQ